MIKCDENSCYIIRLLLPNSMLVIHSHNHIFPKPVRGLTMKKICVTISIFQPKNTGLLIPHSSFLVQQNIDLTFQLFDTNIITKELKCV